ncbi:MAG: alpha/beta fold hydrolase, partial [Mucilaginibacter sp.]
MNKNQFRLFTITLLLAIGSHSFAQSKIDTTEILRVGGIKQVVRIEGRDRSKPLFLFITGGPGSEGIYPENKAYLDELKKHLTVVTWDQRNCGQTLKLNPSPQKLTVQLYENDTHELVAALLKQFHRKKM